MATHIEERVRIEAPADVVWAVLSDVERWPEWTASVETVELQNAGPLAATSVARLKQPGYRAAMWRVTAFDAPRRFVWESPIMPGARAIAGHEVTPDGDATNVLLTIDTTGPTSFLADRAVRSASKRFMPMEAAGLKKRSESRARSGGAGI